MPKKFRNKYRIESTRLCSWDYSSNGAYFLTICTANRLHYFGEILDGKMHLERLGEYAKKCWVQIPSHFPYFYLDEFQIMPDHLHGIVLIDKSFVQGRFGFDGTDHAETRQALSLRESNADQINKVEPHFRFRNQGRKTISAMVGSFKSAVTKYCNENQLAFKWQARFHDYIIRNRDPFFRIRNYIRNNPKRWQKNS